MKVGEAEIERRVERFKGAVKAAGVTLTHQRVEIFREVASRLDHPDADTVFRAVQARMPTVSLDTVYRTLWMLRDLGLITTLGPRRESMRFDANLEHHHHYVCVHCGLTRDFESAELAAVRLPDTVRGFGSIVATRVEVRGICGRCAKRRSTTALPRNPGAARGKERGRT